MTKSVKILFVGLLFHSALVASDVPVKFIEKYQEIAVSEMQRTGIPASIKLAQGILESNFGRSKLAQKANNYFGIKCGSDWVGATYYKEDDDYDRRGKLQKSCFRKYNKVKDSWIAHSEFLKKPRYQHLYYFRPDDYKSWARGLRQAGYATSPSYAKDLITIIERYELDRFDNLGSELPKEVEEKERKETPIPVAIEDPIVKSDSRMLDLGVVTSVNDVKVTHSLEGETLRSISERTGISINSLIRYNKLMDNSSKILKTGTRVFLQMKRSSNRERNIWHKVMPGESMFDISQQYGIRLDKLYERNLMEDKTQAAVGSQIILRGRRNDTPELLKSTIKKEEQEDTKNIEEEEKLLPTPIPDFGGVATEAEEDFLDSESVVGLDELEIPTIEEVSTQDEPNTTVWEEELNVEEELANSIPTTSTAKKEKTNTTQRNADYYTVQQKDTLYSIARNHGASIDQIVSWNSLKDNTIYPNQRLRVR